MKRHSLYFLVALFELHLLVRNSLNMQTERRGRLSDNLNQTLNKIKIQRATAAPRARNDAGRKSSISVQCSFGFRDLFSKNKQEK